MIPATSPTPAEIVEAMRTPSGNRLNTITGATAAAAIIIIFFVVFVIALFCLTVQSFVEIEFDIIIGGLHIRVCPPVIWAGRIVDLILDNRSDLLNPCDIRIFG